MVAQLNFNIFGKSITTVASNLHNARLSTEGSHGLNVTSEGGTSPDSVQTQQVLAHSKGNESSPFFYLDANRFTMV